MELYVSRDSISRPFSYIEVRPVEIGVVKERGCVSFRNAPGNGAEEKKFLETFSPMEINPELCVAMFGFLPRGGEVYSVIVEGDKVTAELLDEPYALMSGKPAKNQKKEHDEGCENVSEKKYYL